MFVCSNPSDGDTTSYGAGVVRDVISHVVLQVFDAEPSPLHRGHNDDLFWLPSMAGSGLLPSVEQMNESMFNGAILGLAIAHGAALPQGLSMMGLFLHLTDVEDLLEAAQLWLPDVANVIADAQAGNLTGLARLAQTYLASHVRVCESNPLFHLHSSM